jgi:hypothetical protein
MFKNEKFGASHWMKEKKERNKKRIFAIVQNKD